jgi:MscS family membrane protein
MTPPPTLQAFLEANTLLLIVLTWLGLGILDYCFHQLETRFKQGEQGSTPAMFLPTVKNVIKLILIISALIIWMDNLGFKVTTLIAGLGVGSLAIALAAQKSIENFIGAIILYTSKPVRVGDFCRFKETLGTVEQIGLRATRIRTLDHSIVTVPNAEFVNLHLDNLTERKKILYRPRISLRYGTSPDQVRSILSGIRELLSSHPRVLPDPARVRFTNFGTYSLDLNIFAYIDENRYNEYLEIAEDINLQIMDVIARADARLAMPTQTNYLENTGELPGLIKTT